MFESTGGFEEAKGDGVASRLPSCPPDGDRRPGGAPDVSAARRASVVDAGAVDAGVVDAVVTEAESALERALRRALESLGDPTAALADGPGHPPTTPQSGGAPIGALAGEAIGTQTAVDTEPPGEVVLTDPALAGLEYAPPGPELAQVLAGVSVADVTDDALVEVVAAAERLRSWALAVQARAAGELVDRAGGSSAAVDGAAAAVGARLCLTRRAAEGLLGLATGLAELPEVADALAGGRIDDRRTRVLIDGCVELPREHRRTVVAALVGGEDGVAGPATRLTGPRLRERLRRAVVAFDPDGGARRREQARADRNVRFEPAGECMAYLTALLPADDAARARAGLDALAVAIHRTPGESRTLDQVRADGLVALLCGSRPVLACDAPAEPLDPGASNSSFSRGPGFARLVTASAETTSPETTSTEATSTEAMSTEAMSTETTSTRGTVPGAADPLGDVLRVADWTAPTVRTVVHVTVAASTLLGRDDLSGTLTGFGPIPAELARQLATGDDVTWQRIVTDPVTGIAADVSRRTYRPGTVLGDLVRVRDATCTFPGCAIPAWRCDLDHVEPFDHSRTRDTPSGNGPVSGTGQSGGPGQTRADNLHPVCRHHHNLKTHGGWTTTRDPVSGVVTWRARTGHEHRVGPHVTDPAHEDAPAPEHPEPHGVETHRGPRPTSPPDDEPPF
jgi:hypothetical protein